MTFQWALTALKEGKKVTRKSWKVSWSKYQNYLFLDRNFLGSLFSFAPGLRWEDYDAEDWEEYTSNAISEEVTGEPI